MLVRVLGSNFFLPVGERSVPNARRNGAPPPGLTGRASCGRMPWGNLPSPTLPFRGAVGTKEVVPMEQFLLDVLAGVVAGIIVLIIGRKFFRK